MLSLNILLSLCLMIPFLASTIISKSNLKSFISLYGSILILSVPFLFYFKSDFNIGNFDINCRDLFVYGFGILSLLLIFIEASNESKNHTENRFFGRYEIYTIVTLLILGVSALCRKNYNLIDIYILLEVISVASIAIISGFGKHYKSSEVGIKYAIFSSLSSAFFLLGSAILFIEFGSFNILDFCSIAVSSVYIYNLGFVLIITSLLMKAGIAPFYIWLADISQGVRFSVINLVQGLSKIAIVLCVANILSISRISFDGNFLRSFVVFILIGVIFSAIRSSRQCCMKRLMANASAVTMGIVFSYLFILKSKNSLLEFNIDNVFIYMTSYVGSSFIVCLSCIFLFNKDSKNFVLISDFTSSVYRRKFYFFLVFGMISFAGLPPMLGFFGKFSFIKDVVDVDVGLYYLIFYIFTLVFCDIVRGFYYFKIPTDVLISSLDNEEKNNSCDSLNSGIKKFAFLLLIIVSAFLSIGIILF